MMVSKFGFDCVFGNRPHYTVNELSLAAEERTANKKAEE